MWNFVKFYIFPAEFMTNKQHVIMSLSYSKDFSCCCKFYHWDTLEKCILLILLRTNRKTSQSERSKQSRVFSPRESDFLCSHVRGARCHAASGRDASTQTTQTESLRHRHVNAVVSKSLGPTEISYYFHLQVSRYFFVSNFIWCVK